MVTKIRKHIVLIDFFGNVTMVLYLMVKLLTILMTIKRIKIG